MDTQIGEVVVYNVKGKDIPIVHRVVRRFGGGYVPDLCCSSGTMDAIGANWASRRDKPLKLLTKGDNNLSDDTELYARGQAYLERSKDVIGSVVGYIPFVGYVTILLSEHPWLKTVMLGLMGVMVVIQRE